LARAARRQHQDPIRNTVGDRPYEIVTRVYGRDGVMGALEPQRRVIDGVGGHEAFILWDVISESQELSRTIATSLSHLAVHNPIPKWYRRARDAEIVNRAAIARLYNRDPAEIIVVNHDTALAIKVSFPRPRSSGSKHDSDVYGGQQYAPLLGLEVPG